MLQKQPTNGVLRKRCSETMQQISGEHPCWSAISIKMRSKFIEITLRHGRSPVILLDIFRTHFLKNTSRRLLMNVSNYFLQNLFPAFSKTNKLLGNNCATSIVNAWLSYVWLNVSIRIFSQCIVSRCGHISKWVIRDMKI